MRTGRGRMCPEGEGERERGGGVEGGKEVGGGGARVGMGGEEGGNLIRAGEVAEWVGEKEPLVSLAEAEENDLVEGRGGGGREGKGEVDRPL